MCDLRVALHRSSDSSPVLAAPEDSGPPSDSGELPGVCLEQPRRSLTGDGTEERSTAANGDL